MQVKRVSCFWVSRISLTITFLFFVAQVKCVELRYIAGVVMLHNFTWSMQFSVLKPRFVSVAPF